MEHRELQEYLADRFGGFALFEPEYYDDGIVGVTDEGNVVYSYEKLAGALMEHDGMTHEEAVEWLDYNTVRTVPFMGKFKPIIIYDIEW